MFKGQIKDIHIGNFIRQIVSDSNIELEKICNFMNCSEDEVHEVFSANNLDTEDLLKWSKFLSYDFFRLYSYHLSLYSSNPQALNTINRNKSKVTQFRKSMYSKEIIMFILEMIEKKEMTTEEVIKKYNIGKTTIYKWKAKYSTNLK